MQLCLLQSFQFPPSFSPDCVRTQMVEEGLKGDRATRPFGSVFPHNAANVITPYIIIQKHDASHSLSQQDTRFGTNHKAEEIIISNKYFDPALENIL